MIDRVQAIVAADAPPRLKPSNYPEPFASRMAGRVKRPLGELFGLTNFGVNHTTLEPGAVTTLHHRHSRQDELVYVLAGHPTLYIGRMSAVLAPGMVIGFPHNSEAHHVKNETAASVVLLEVGDRSAGDEVEYPDDDIHAVQTKEGWSFAHKDGRHY
jgi:uncharacterized cupin superfamily protein